MTDVAVCQLTPTGGSTAVWDPFCPHKQPPPRRRCTAVRCSACAPMHAGVLSTPAERAAWWQRRRRGPGRGGGAKGGDRRQRALTQGASHLQLAPFPAGSLSPRSVPSDAAQRSPPVDGKGRSFFSGSRNDVCLCRRKSAFPNKDHCSLTPAPQGRGQGGYRPWPRGAA